MPKLGIVFIYLIFSCQANADYQQMLAEKVKTYRDEDMWIKIEKTKATSVNGKVYEIIADRFKQDEIEEMARQYEKEHYKPAQRDPSDYFPTADEVTKSWEQARQTYRPGDKAILDKYSKFLGWVPRKCPND